jgi:hypothetical protein
MMINANIAGTHYSEAHNSPLHVVTDFLTATRVASSCQLADINFGFGLSLLALFFVAPSIASYTKRGTIF